MRVMVGLRALLLALPLAVSGCVLDREAALREELADVLFLRDTVYFKGRIGCTAGLFTLYARYPKVKVVETRDVDAALRLMRSGRAVAIDAGISPNDVSKEVLSRELGRGLGMLSAGVAGAMDCLTQDLELPLYEALIDPQVVTVYDPVSKVLMLVEWSKKRAWVLRSMA